MDIRRINTYEDDRFTKKALYQHGCYLVDGYPFEVIIISSYEAIISGNDQSRFTDVIEEFRFNAPHITKYYDRDTNIVAEFEKKELFRLRIEEIQPSQLYIDLDKVKAVDTFINSPEDVIIPVVPWRDKYIAMDGHTRLYVALKKGYQTICALKDTPDDVCYDFVKDVIAKGVREVKDMKEVSHEDYEILWNQYCEDFFRKKSEK